MAFSGLGLSTTLLKALQANNYKQPYPIQKQAIPAILEKKDVLGIAQTGSGKTASYVLPILINLATYQPSKNRQIPVLVVVPTRELAVQVKDLTEDELLDFMAEVKEAIPTNIPIGYVDAYYEFSHRPRITDACDVILANCYPYWEGCPIEYSLQHMKQMYYQAAQAGNGKRVIITETGWPSQGGGFKGSLASMENYMKYFINGQAWSAQDNIEMFYFASFDESWKVGAEGDVGAYWGLWDKNENLKF